VDHIELLIVSSGVHTSFSFNRVSEFLENNVRLRTGTKCANKY
jgi:hypothetical protein